MKTEIKLKAENSETIHVDNVDPKQGVYAKTSGSIIAYWIEYEMCFIRPDDGSKNNTHYDSFKEAVRAWSACWDIFTLSGNRVIGEKRLTVEDLKNSDHVGFVSNDGDKGHVIYTTSDGCNGKYTCAALSCFDFPEHCNIQFGGSQNSLQDAVTNMLTLEKEDQPKQVFIFTSRQELYKWLSEEEV